jgi:hypothetical protein
LLNCFSSDHPAGSIVTPISHRAIISPAQRSPWQPGNKLVADNTPTTDFPGIVASANNANQTSTTGARLQVSDDSVVNLSNPATPSAYELVFGPTSGANNAPGVRL